MDGFWSNSSDLVKVIVAVLGVIAGVIGLITALISRRKEIVHLREQRTEARFTCPNCHASNISEKAVVCPQCGEETPTAKEAWRRRVGDTIFATTFSFMGFAVGWAIGGFLVGMLGFLGGMVLGNIAIVVERRLYRSS